VRSDVPQLAPVQYSFWYVDQDIPGQRTNPATGVVVCLLFVCCLFVVVLLLSLLVRVVLDSKASC
jgi:ABC-type uncharacterized transport system YnjBCD permease subunit